MSVRCTVLALPAVCLCTLVVDAGEQPIVTTDVLRLRSVSAIDVTDDGARVVFAVRSIGESNDDERKDYRNRSHLFLLDLTRPDAQPVQLTWGDRRDTSPAVAPDGRRVAFVRAGAGDGSDDEPATAQVWIMSLFGGEPRQVTQFEHFEHGAMSPVWSPDGRQLLVTSEIPMAELDGPAPWPSQRPGRVAPSAPLSNGQRPRPDGSRAEIRAWLEANAEKLDPSVIDRLDFQDEQKLSGRMQFGQLFIVDPDDDQRPPRRITSAFQDHRDAVFAADGASILYSTRAAGPLHPDQVLERVIRRISVDGTGDAHVLAMDGWVLETPRPSRDRSVIGFVGVRADNPAFRYAQLGIASLQDDGASDVTWLTEEKTAPGDVNDFCWAHTQPSIVFSTAAAGGFPLMTITPGLIEPAPMVTEDEHGPIGVRAFDVGGGATVYAVTSVSNPCVLRVRDGHGDRLAYDLNTWVADKKLSMPTMRWITRPDDTRMQYWLMEPTDRIAGQRYPLVLEIHGGPSAMWGPGEFSMWHEFQLLCSWGYGVVYANQRGSGGYGEAFLRANFQDWGEGPAGDALAAVDHAMLEEWVDPDRLIVTGGSYAGYLTAWIVGHDHRFKAAVAQRGVYDLTTFFGEGNAWRLVEWSMGGRPWDARIAPVLRRESPITYVQRVRTPLLIMHASNDLRTGVSQSEMLYRSLKALDKPVEYVRYPNAGHDLSRTGDPGQRMDRLNRIIDFFERHVENPRTAPRVD